VNTTDLTTKLHRLKGQRSQLQRQLKTVKSTYITAYRNVAATEEAKALLQKVAKETQDQLRYHVTDLGSMALEAVFGPGTKLDLEFKETNGKTSAQLRFLTADGNATDPLEEDSGGAADIAAFALRCSLWAMQRPRTRAVMIMDEPAKNINDETREMQKRYAEMVKEVSERLGMQFIIVTQIQELEEVADKIFRF